MRSNKTERCNTVPHSGALCHLEDKFETFYTIAICTDKDNCHELVFTRSDLSFAQRLFSILDTESRGLVGRRKVREFTTQRCPVFWRRDDDLRKLCLTAPREEAHDADNSPTFDEIWESVVACSRIPVECSSRDCDLGLEAWMVFCRFIALAQYLEAKRRFSARHLQQTMRHRNSPRGSEVVMVDVPPPEPPAPLSLEQLASHEQRNQSPLPVPELDLDHSLLAVHDSTRRPTANHANGRVKIDLFGHLHHSSSSNASLEFAVTFTRPSGTDMDQTVVRRSLADMRWLDDTVTSHKALGGTLCGRILPPFPSSGSRKILSKFNSEDSLLNSSIKNTGGAIAAAAAGVGKIKSVAKSLFGTYLDFSSTYLDFGGGTQPKSKGSNKTPATNALSDGAQKKASRQMIASTSLPESYYNPHSPDGKARQLERYLNYLLDHPALSSSFPLNAVLTASQSGLDAAKRSLDECNKAAKEIREQTPQLDDGGMLFVPLWSGSGSSDSGHAPNFAWVRTAAQAAMALRVHGMLETTGLPSASARLQHASLPAFGKAKQGSWEDDSGGEQAVQKPNEAESTTAEGHNNFEEGVVSVHSELQSSDNFERSDDGYDMLPLPVPAPERRILTVGNSSSASNKPTDSRFHYGNAADLDFLSFDNEDDSRSVLLGNMLVDDNIDKLREVIGSVDNTLSRCLGSSGSIGSARRERLRLQLEVIRGLDSWEGMRGQFVSQRALLRGVGGMSQSREICEESDLILVDDLSWQTCLAHSAVSASEDVRSAIRASRTAANAKAAANSAAMSAQAACRNGDFATMEEARAAQTRSSIAQSHAIHAAVVDHEAKAAKRRATLALAHDVKCWNVHRKSELLQSCLSYARSQHESTRRAVDAWSTLRDGFIGSPLIPTAHERRMPIPPKPPASSLVAESSVGSLGSMEPNEATTTIFGSMENSGDMPAIVPSEHVLFNAPTTEAAPMTEADAATAGEENNWGEPAHEGAISNDPILAAANEENGWGEPTGEGATSPILTSPNEDNDWGEPMGGAAISEDPVVDTADKPTDFFGSDLILPFARASPVPEETDDSGEQILHNSHSHLEPKGEETLSASMQSLVEGLMSWGGGLDAEEDHMALPMGMAASIALEESGKLA